MQITNENTCDSVLNVKALVIQFQQETRISVIVKSSSNLLEPSFEALV